MRIAGTQIDLTPTQFDIAGGVLAAEGRFDADARSAVQVFASDLHLQDFASVLPEGPQARGVLDARVSFEGTTARPSLEVSLQGRNLEYDDRKFGDLQLSADYRNALAQADVGWQGGDAGVVHVQVKQPLRIDLGAKSPLRPLGSRNFAASVDVRDVDLEWWTEWLPGPLAQGVVSLRLRATGTGNQPVVALELDTHHLVVDELAIGNVGVVGAYDAKLAHLQLDLRGGRTGKGTVGITAPVALDLAKLHAGLELRRAPAQIAFELEDTRLSLLEPWMPGTDGVVTGRGWASTEGGEVKAEIDLMARSMKVRDQAVGTLTTKLELGGGDLVVDVQGSGAVGRLVSVHARAPLAVTTPTFALDWRRNDAHQVYVEVRDADLATLAQLGGAGAVAGEVGGAIELSGPATDPRIAAGVRIRRFANAGHALGTVAMRATYDGDHAFVRLDQSHRRQALALEANVPVGLDLATPNVQWHDEKPHRLRVRAAGVDQYLVGAFVALPDALRFDVSARVEGEGSRGDFALLGELRAHLKADKAIDTALAGRFDVRPAHQRAELVIGPYGNKAFEVTADVDAPLPALLAKTATAADVVVDVKASATDFPLAAIAPALPEAIYGLKGLLTLDAAIKGPIINPELTGDATIRDGSATVVALQQRLRDIDASVSLRDGMVKIDRLRLRSGGGRIDGKGWVRLATGDTRGALGLKIKDLPIVKPGLPVMKLSLNVDTKLDATGEMTDVKVGLRKANLDVLGANVDAPAAIPESDSVVYIDPEGRRADDAGDAVTPKPLIPSNIRVEVDLVDSAIVSGGAIDMTWDGKITVVHTPGEPVQSVGALEAERGFISLLGNQFTLESGRITMPPEGEIDPFIAIVATTELAEARVTMRIQGRASRPELKLESDPVLPESDIFALLITGQTSIDGSESEDYRAQAASLLAALQSPALQRQLHDRLGIDRVGVGFGDEVNQPILTVGKRLTRKVYVETTYHHNAPPTDNTAELRLEYTFAPPHWSVETFFGDAAEGGIGLWWRRRFGGGADPQVEPAKPGDADNPPRRER